MPRRLKNFLKTLGVIFDGLWLVELVASIVSVVGAIVTFVFSFFP